MLCSIHLPGFRMCCFSLLNKQRRKGACPLISISKQLRSLQHVGMPGYEVRSQVPFVGRLIAWVRRQLTSHLKEPYLDPIVARQEEFNRELVQTLVPAVEQSLYEQRRLRREVAMLRERLAEQEEHRV